MQAPSVSAAWPPVSIRARLLNSLSRSIDQWKKRFGPLYRFADLGNWRLVFLDSIVPNPDGKLGKGPIYGIDDEQLRWLEGVLREAAASSRRALLFAHVPPGNYTYRPEDFERAASATGCVRGMFCGHTHKNSRTLLGDIPVMIRVSNAAAPLGYSLIYPYPDDRLLVVQKSQIDR